MKNTLAENLLRFGVKNLSEADKSRLTEADAPSKPDATVEIEGSKVTYKIGLNKQGLESMTSPLVIQSPSSLGEASAILGGMLKVIGQGNAEGDKMIALINKINANNYPAILWKVRYGSTFKNANRFKSNFNLLSDWLSKYVSEETRGGEYQNIPGSGGKGPFGGLRDFIVGVDTAKAFNAHVPQFNVAEELITY
jgi:hypothetical protein